MQLSQFPILSGSLPWISFVFSKRLALISLGKCHFACLASSLLPSTVSPSSPPPLSPLSFLPLPALLPSLSTSRLSLLSPLPLFEIRFCEVQADLWLSMLPRTILNFWLTNAGVTGACHRESLLWAKTQGLVHTWKLLYQLNHIYSQSWFSFLW